MELGRAARFGFGSTEETVMRRVQRIVGLSLFMSFCAGHALGCFFTLDLDHLDCDLFSHAGCSAGGGTPAGCVPSENSKPVEETCGVFVSSSRGAEALPERRARR